MEPTGIEPVTSCLQSDVANPSNRPVSGVDAGLGPSRRDGDTAGLGAMWLGLGSGIGLLPKRLIVTRHAPPCVRPLPRARPGSSAGGELAHRSLAAADERLAVREQEAVEIEVEQPAKRFAQPGPHR
jgi:hypothetical protein